MDTIHRKELYKPYRGEYYLSGPSTAHNPPIFQPGFDYEFVDVSQAGPYQQPSAYEDVSFSFGQVVSSYYSDYLGPIIHNNKTTVQILQLDTQQPRMCYNNYNYSPKDGSVITFLDGVPNGNFTIAAKDSLQINDPNLINNLQPGLYNVLKNYNDGTTEQTTIQ